MRTENDSIHPYRRICAHRGFNSVLPENSMPAFGAAVALGADEIEFDLWSTKDGELVSIHDRNLERVSDGHGLVTDHTLAEIESVDFGIKRGERFKGLRIVRFEDILRRFAGTVIMNIHMKIWDIRYDSKGAECPDPQYRRIADLLRKYDCAEHVYMMSHCDECLREFHEIAPEIHRCAGFDGNKTDPLAIVDRAISLGCEKVQLFKPYFTQESVDRAHANGIICNVFYADDPEEACRYIDMGIDTILTNDYLTIANAVHAHLA